jgi:superoxide dismutase, Fe-Mn family
MQFELPPLPYPVDALAPHISKEQLFYHYEKHHRGYLKKLDTALTDPKRRALDLEAIVRTSSGKVFNFAAQLWNHTFLWHSLTPHTTRASAQLQRFIDESFDGVDGFRKAFAKAAASEFGSGWAWLIVEPSTQHLAVISTHDADTPLTSNDQVPLLTLDLWEHAYYLDYKNDRAAYIDAFLHELINWNFANANLERCVQPTQPTRRRASG